MTGPVDVEEMLARFRDWLREARAELEETNHEPAPPEAEVHEIGLYQLVEEFTALRHELKLETRSSRALQEQTQSAVTALGQAIDQFRAVEPKEAQAAWAAGKSLAEAVTDLDEALDRGRSEIERARRRIVDESGKAVESALEGLLSQASWFQRRTLRAYHEQVLGIFRQHTLEVRREMFDALIEGYGLIQNRLQRALKAEGIHRIECVGRPVNPELMTVIEVVDDPDRPPGHVVAEVRRGYTWQGRLLRYAEVRASRTPTS